MTRAHTLRWFTFYLEDCCANHTVEGVNVGPLRFWAGFLAGPQQAGYRHLLVRNAGGDVATGDVAPIAFLHLNCEHGTGAGASRGEIAGALELPWSWSCP